MLACVEAADHRPALGEVMQLAERAQVAQEVRRLILGLEAEQRGDELVDVVGPPVVHRRSCRLKEVGGNRHQ